MSKIDEFDQKINIFEKRTQNKKYLAKNKIFQEKFFMFFLIEKFFRKIWKIKILQMELPFEIL